MRTVGGRKKSVEDQSDISNVILKRYFLTCILHKSKKLYIKEIKEQ